MAKNETSIFHRFRLQGLSIQQRLPLLICGLLLSVLVTFSLIAYVGLRKAAITTGKDRLESLTTQLSGLFGQSMQAFIASSSVAVQDSAVKRYARSGGMSGKAETVAVLTNVLKDSLTVLIEVRDMAHNQLLRTGRDSANPRVKTDRGALPAKVAGPVLGIGGIVTAGDSLMYPVVIPLQENKRDIGYVVRWRILSASAKAIRQFNDLIGTDANMYVSNADGSTWTDLRSSVPAPFAMDTMKLKEPFSFRDNNGRMMIASARMIPYTPWMVMTGFSKSTVIASANSFLRMTLLAGGLIMLIAILLAWRMSHNLIRPLESLTQAAAVIATGEYTQPVPVHRKDEVGNLARAFNTMMLKIQKAKKDMEKQLLETKELNDELRKLSAHLQNIREEERIHIAREMHDELGGLLTGFKMDVAGLHKKFTTAEDPAIHEKLASMKTMTDDAVKFVRRLAAELRPSILDDLGLIAALEWHGKEFEKRHGITVDFTYNVEEVTTNSLVATGLFRMYQESLTNVARHSAADNVTAILTVNDDIAELSIKDNGRGFDTTEGRKTLGLLGMKERAVMIGGRLQIISAPGKGTEIRITVPVGKQ